MQTASHSYSQTGMIDSELPPFWQTFGPLFLSIGFVFSALFLFAFISRNRPKNQEIEERHSSVLVNKWIREFWFWLTNPVFTFFVKFKVSPNAISILGTVGALMSGVAFYFNMIGLGGWIMVLGASLDLFDGRVARAMNRVTLAGCYIDSCMDRISEGVTLTAIAYIYKDGFGFWIVMLVYLASQLTSYTKSKGETLGVNYSGGMMQRPERIVYLGAGGILTPAVAYILYPFLKSKMPTASYVEMELMIYLVPLSFVAFFATTTSINRIINIMKLLDKKQFGSSR